MQWSKAAREFTEAADEFLKWEIIVGGIMANAQPPSGCEKANGIDLLEKFGVRARPRPAAVLPLEKKEEIEKRLEPLPHEIPLEPPKPMEMPTLEELLDLTKRLREITADMKREADIALLEAKLGERNPPYSQCHFRAIAFTEESLWA